MVKIVLHTLHDISIPDGPAMQTRGMIFPNRSQEQISLAALKRGVYIESQKVSLHITT